MRIGSEHRGETERGEILQEGRGRILNNRKIGVIERVEEEIERKQ